MPDLSQVLRPHAVLFLRIAAFTFLLVLVIPINLAWALQPDAGLRDFGSFVASGQAASEGKDPYGIYPLTFHVTIGPADVDSPNLNPPISVLAFQWLARMDPVDSFRVWAAVSFLLYVAGLGLLGFFRRSRLLALTWALALGGLWHTLYLGQIYLPLLVCGIIAWLLLKRNRLCLAGIVLGVLVAFKPNFALWPLLLALAGYPAVTLWALMTAATLSALPLLAYGWLIYDQWLEVLALQTTSQASVPLNASLLGMGTLVGLPSLGSVAVGGLLIAASVWALRVRRDRGAVTNLSVVISLLASPLTWPGYTLFLLPVLASRPWTPLTVVAASAFAVPVVLLLSSMEISTLHFVVFGSLYGIAILLVLVDLALDLRRPARTAPAGPVDFGIQAATET